MTALARSLRRAEHELKGFLRVFSQSSVKREMLPPQVWREAPRVPKMEREAR